MNPSNPVTEPFEVKLEGLALTLLDVCQAATRFGVDSCNLKLSDELIRELGPTLNWVGRELVEPFFCYLCQSNGKAVTFSQVIHLKEVYLSVERIQVVPWISIPLVARYLGNFESGRKGLFLNLLSEGRIAVVSYLPAWTARPSMRVRNSSNSANAGSVPWLISASSWGQLEGLSPAITKSVTQVSSLISVDVSYRSSYTIEDAPRGSGATMLPHRRPTWSRVLASVLSTNSLLTPRWANIRCLPWPGLTSQLAPPVVSSLKRR